MHQPHTHRRPLAILALLAFATGTAPLPAATHRVGQSNQLLALLPALAPGDRVLLEPGTYNGQVRVHGLRGTPEAPLTIRAADPQQPPIFQSGAFGLQFSACRYLRIQHLNLRGFADAGIVVDDGGDTNAVASHLLLESIRVHETGLRGNHDAFHLFNAEDLTLRDCEAEAWGGSGVDIVGCRRVMVDRCRFIGRDSCDQASGVQIRAGSRDVIVQRSFFRWSGATAIAIGGVSAPTDFRPPTATAEASGVIAAGNRILGTFGPIAWNAADGGRACNNTIILPHRWVMRILHDSTNAALTRCRNGSFDRNVVLYDQRVFNVVNRDTEAAAETFTFASNAWYRLGAPKAPHLPTPDLGSVTRVDPQIPMSGPQAYSVTATDPRLAGLGADAHVPLPPPFEFPAETP